MHICRIRILFRLRHFQIRSMQSSPMNFTPPFVGSIDQGTTSTRFIVFDYHARIVSQRQKELLQIVPKPGWTEHDPEVIFKDAKWCIQETLKDMAARGLPHREIKAIGITNQRETTVVWEKKTGKPLHNAIVWLDTRTRSSVEKLASCASDGVGSFKSKVGLPISTYFSAVKLNWLLNNVSTVKEAAKDDQLAFGTIDSWLIYKLTGGKVHVTDVTNASRTMLMSLDTLDWDDEMCKFFDVPPSCLPEVKSSSEHYGNVDEGLPLAGIPISGCLGDQQAALVGQLCFLPGEVKNTYGTGCFTLFNTGATPVLSKNGLLTTVAYKLGANAPVAYALEGSVAIGGAAIKWLRDNLGIIKESSEISEYAAQVPDTAGLTFVPAFSGLFAPYWRTDARGVMVGITSFTNRSHLCRATLEAVCFQSKEVIDSMNNDSGQALRLLKVDGGLTNSDLCMQIQADVLGIDVERPVMRETTALGAALAAGLAAGVWKDLKTDFKSLDGCELFHSNIKEVERSSRFTQWKDAVQRSMNLA